MRVQGCRGLTSSTNRYGHIILKMIFDLIRVKKLKKRYYLSDSEMGRRIRKTKPVQGPMTNFE